MLTDFEKEIKKRLIDLDMTHFELALKVGFKSSWALRKSLRSKKAKIQTIEKIKEILSI